MGYNVDNVYDSGTWLKASDLGGKEHRVKITEVRLAEVQNEKKLELEFEGRDKRLLVNKTNSRAIAGAYGSDTDGWLGKAIILYPQMVEFQGRSVESVRVRPELERAAPDDAEDFDDSDIPF